ncbi:hypothetical protein [Bacteroidetes bacterium endosymbiont of Geopemphigus sp.]|uniref:hypothetical protein n=1 Tax=Bacteroidetes bacterium endosymbiont of Geopemphigus sp. TaxID=2047937 RepID=UPI0011AF5F57
MFIHSASTLSDEYRFLLSEQPEEKWRIFQKRQPKLEYRVDHLNDQFYIVTNKDRAMNFKVMKTYPKQNDQKYWIDMIPHRENYLVEDIELFKDYLAVQQRHRGRVEFHIQRWDGDSNYQVDFGEESYMATYRNKS